SFPWPHRPTGGPRRNLSPRNSAPIRTATDRLSLGIVKLQVNAGNLRRQLRQGISTGSCDEGHLRTDPALHPIIVRNSSKRYWLSCGPAEASGWYCTLKTGRRLCRRPSSV